MGMLHEFKEFAMRGNVIDLAVGVVIGAAFGKIVTALVEKIIRVVPAGYGLEIDTSAWPLPAVFDVSRKRWIDTGGATADAISAQGHQEVAATVQYRHHGRALGQAGVRQLTGGGQVQLCVTRKFRGRQGSAGKAQTNA